MLDLWRLFQSSMTPLLPEAGGTGDQAALMLDAFAIMSAAEAKLKPKG